MAKEQTIKRSKKARKNVEEGIIHINATYNNTHISISDLDGNALCWVSGGRVGFKWARESTPYAATIAAEHIVEEAQRLHGFKKWTMIVKGIWPGRDNAIRGIVNAGIEIDAVYDETPVPYNGTKKKKIRKP